MMSYSNIQEAWNHDPVKEITKKLSSNEFNIFDNRSQRCKFSDSDTDKKIVRSTQTPPELSFTANDEAIETVSSTSFEPNYYFRSESVVPKTKPSRRRSRATTRSDEVSLDRSHKCAGHIKKCNHCYKTLKKLVNEKIRSKIDEIMLDTKLKQMQATPMTPYPLIQPFTTSTQPVTAVQNDAWKETLIVMLGGIVALVLIYLIVKTFCQPVKTS